MIEKEVLKENALNSKNWIIVLILALSLYGLPSLENLAKIYFKNQVEIEKEKTKQEALKHSISVEELKKSLELIK